VTKEERDELLADEWLMVRHSGEIPEITFHSSLYYLTKESDGPGLSLTEEELASLKDAALLRYQEIILRDISVENFHKTIYRGVRRTLYNWHRYKAFTLRQSIACGHFRETAAQTFVQFLEQGVSAAGKSLPEHFINCSAEQLIALGEELGVTVEQFPPAITQYCLSDSKTTKGEKTCPMSISAWPESSVKIRKVTSARV
jgi:hypothetical protein